MRKDWMPAAAGVMQIVSGVCAFIGACAVAFSAVMINHIPDMHEEEVPVELLTSMLGGLALFIGLFGVVAVVGGVLAVRRRGLGWAIAGSIAALFTMPPLGIVSLILVLVGESEFEGREAAIAKSAEAET